MMDSKGKNYEESNIKGSTEAKGFKMGRNNWFTNNLAKIQAAVTTK